MFFLMSFSFPLGLSKKEDEVHVQPSSFLFALPLCNPHIRYQGLSHTAYISSDIWSSFST